MRDERDSSQDVSLFNAPATPAGDNFDRGKRHKQVELASVAMLPSIMKAPSILRVAVKQVCGCS